MIITNANQMFYLRGGDSCSDLHKSFTGVSTSRTEIQTKTRFYTSRSMHKM